MKPSSFKVHRYKEVAMPNRAELKFKPASVTLQQEKCVLTVGNTSKTIPTAEINDAASVRKLVGKKDVIAAYSGRTIVAIGRRIAPCYWILCYIPAPDIFRKIRPEIRQDLLNKYVNEGVIDRKFAEELKTSF
jgi:hypothetical protein